MNISPVGLPIKQWCDFMVPQLSQFGQAPFLQDEDEWVDWARQICLLPGVAGFNPPNPRYFDDFYIWAERFNSAVNL